MPMEFRVLAPIDGFLWRLGNEGREIGVGDLVKKGEEIANIEAHKIQFIVTSPCDGEVKAIFAKTNSFVRKDSVLFVIESFS